MCPSSIYLGFRDLWHSGVDRDCTQEREFAFKPPGLKPLSNYLESTYVRNRGLKSENREA